MIIPVLATLWSLTNNNNYDYLDLKLYYQKSPMLHVEVNSIQEPIITNQFRLPEVKSIPEPKEIQIVTEVSNKKNSSIDQIKCMATNIYFEAGSEPFMGQVAVARVVMNRILHGFASTPCKVIYQTTKRKDPSDEERAIIHCQFSWVCQGKLIPHKDNPKYQQAEDIARRVLDHDEWKDEIPDDILFFHNTTVNPRWPYAREFKIGNHIFYSKSDKSKNENTRNSRSDK